MRVVERFAYHAVSVAESEAEIEEARSIMRLAVGLRRKLDVLKTKKLSEEA